jgi:hypothetical protein
VNFRRTLAIGAGILALYAGVVGVARLVYGPGDTIAPDQLSGVVLQQEDVSGARLVDSCEHDNDPEYTEALPDDAILAVFRFAVEESADASRVCVQAGVRRLESQALAAAAFQESVDYLREYDEGFGVPELEDAFNLERFKTAGIGHRSFSFTVGCDRDCTPEDGRSYIIQFQRSNVVSFVAVSGPESDDLLDDAIEYARKQDQRIVMALKAND